MVMLITEHDPRTLRQPVRQPRTATRRALDLSKVKVMAQTAVKTLSAAGSFRAWACFTVVGYVFIVAVMNLVRFGIER
jgi:hypothetical protein